MSKRRGKCCLCGQECELSFEHIPPRAAFNSDPAKPVKGTEFLTDQRLNNDSRMPWETKGLKYENQQQGMGMFSLCTSCNNNTGSWYGADYIKFARTMHIALQKGFTAEENAIQVYEVYPLRIIKQILSMFCSINTPDNENLDEIRRFVLDKDAVGLDKSKYKLCMYFTKSTFVKYNGHSVLILHGEKGGSVVGLSELTAYPFGFILYFDPPEGRNYQGFDITSFAEVGYDSCVTVEMPLDIREVNDFFPEQYRSRDEIRKCFEENRQQRVEDTFHNNECKTTN